MKHFRSMAASALFPSVVLVMAAGGPQVSVTAQDAGGPARRLDCAALAGLRLTNARITEAVAAPAPATGSIKVTHCRVSGVIDKEIRFTALLPDRWNQRFFGGGGGGFVGAVSNQAQASVNFGYATIGTDTGHQADGVEASWALNNPERQANYGSLAIHRTAEIGKAIVKAYYGTDPVHSYFYGCSNGGRQGLMEAQRFPADYDGIVSGAPALDFTNIAAAFVRHMQAVFPDPRALSDRPIPAATLQLLETKVLEACDARDGVKDGVMDDPRACRFRIADLPACTGDASSPGCVTGAQRSIIERLYAPVTAGGTAIYPGQPFGGEAQPGGWQAWITGANPPPSGPPNRPPSLQFAFGTEFFKYFVFGNPDWDYSKYDMASWARDTRSAAAILNADNPDLGAFKARGGKLILSHGWADPALNALTTIKYFEAVQARNDRAGEFVRLFMMPGVLHCGGGPGPDTVDWFTPIADWVEKGRAPERLTARKIGPDGSALNSRPLCPYPQRAVHDGKGATTEAASYACKAR